MDPPRRREVNRAETYKKWVKLHLADITASLASFNEYAHESTFFLNGHPVRWVYVVGTVVAINDEQEKKTVLTIDDGSGQTINAVASRDRIYLKNVPQLLHSTVKAKGQLELLHGAWQMKLMSLEADLSLDDQVKFWKEANQTHDRLATTTSSTSNSSSTTTSATITSKKRKA
ncbi:hypothetical protein H072_10151 [Dactylellina haptotyla CBS 200.50]|uniref:CST complex subunit Stn1 N-terminal domain-containing protein n=1 Tax=Dactylellina haptotyla (strain CBS 200.50) TaxID=1284197 RepID=S8A030_DACHA|nr:hypothetical protein H072_10151 [Dactylellina haptotyla CBS 200.50]